MWVAPTSPPRRLRPAVVVAALLAPVLGTAFAPGPLGFLGGTGRPPRPRVEHSYVAGAAGGTAQHLIPAPGGRGPSGPAATATVPAPAPGSPGAPLAPGPAAPDAAPAPAATRSTAAGPGPAADAPDPPVPPAAAALAAVIDAHLADDRLAGTTVGLSVWVDGLGEVSRHGDVPLTPASNEKLLTAMGVLSLLPQADTLVTEVRAAGPQDGGALDGDLVLVGGGDPTLQARGPHSLDDLAAAVKARGIDEVRGALVGDESRYDHLRSAPGWLPEHVPVFIGPLSALVVDRNQLRPDADYAADPVPGDLAYFRAALLRAGVRVDGPNAAATAPNGSTVLAALASPPIGDLVGEMLNQSDNLVAELLVKEVAHRTAGGAPGSTAAGLAAITAAVQRQLGVPLAGVAADGSGLSRDDRRSPREWRTLLQAALARPWAERLVGSLPLAARTGTLVRRFAGTAAEGNVRAKTGWIDEARSLSGYLTTAGGRHVVFSVIVNGTTPASPALNALDGLVAAIAGDRS